MLLTHAIPIKILEPDHELKRSFDPVMWKYFTNRTDFNMIMIISYNV